MESYADIPRIEEKTLVEIRKYIRKLFGGFPVLKAHNIIQDDIESDVCYYMYKDKKKKDENGNIYYETFTDSMRKIKTEKHYRAFIKNCVMNTLLTKAREVEKKPIFASLDYTGENIKSYTDECLGESLESRIPDPSAFVEPKIMISIAMSSIEDMRYPEYVFHIDENNTKVLEARDIMEWIITGRQLSALAKSITIKGTDENIKVKELDKEVNIITKKLRKELED